MTRDTIRAEDVVIGSYSLETLTTGMYEDPLHCLREYVQNSYDAIRNARAAGVLGPEEGAVGISVSTTAKRSDIVIKDDGTGIPSTDAIRALVSVGASRKRSDLNAGFRGIGRLAGIAYCTSLRFVTTVSGEDVASVVEFDCGRMRGNMLPGADFTDMREIIRRNVRSETRSADVADHGTEVHMLGLTGTGLEFREMERLLPYLRQVCPVEYSDRFSHAADIRAFAARSGQPLDTIEVETRYKRERTQVLKAYDDVGATADPDKASRITGVHLVDAPDLGWHGWIGLSNFRGELNDGMVAGVRFRLRNIQVGGSGLIEELGSELTKGGTEGRLQRYAMGEVFITNPSVIPNARRDGFEDGAAWRAIRSDVRERIAREVVSMVRSASRSRSRIKTILGAVEALEKQLNGVPSSARTIAQIETGALDLLARLQPERLPGSDPDEVGRIVARVKGVQDRVVEAKGRSRGGGQDGAHGNGESGSANDAHDASDGGAASGSERSGATSAPGDPDPTSLLDALVSVLIREFGRERVDALLVEARRALR